MQLPNTGECVLAALEVIDRGQASFVAGVKRTLFLVLAWSVLVLTFHFTVFESKYSFLIFLNVI